MNWILLLFYFEVGFLPINGWIVYEDDQYQAWVQDKPSFYTEMDAEILLLDTIFVGGSVRTDVRPVYIDNYDPYWMTYSFTAGFRFGPVEGGFRHSCFHPIQTYAGLSDQLNPIAEGAYREIYLRVGNR